MGETGQTYLVVPSYLLLCRISMASHTSGRSGISKMFSHLNTLLADSFILVLL